MRLDKTKLQQLARALQLNPRRGETTEQIFARCITRAQHLADLMIAAEASDPDRQDWAWSETE